MPIRAMLSSKLISIGTSFFVLLGSGHYDLNHNSQNGDIPATTEVTITEPTIAISHSDTASTEAEILPISEASSEKTEAITLTATTISVSCIKLEWNGDKNAQYSVTVTQTIPDEYIDNIYFEFKSNTLCYITGLRENSEYTFDIADENGNILATVVQRTEAVEVIQEFDYIDGWTNCFAGERVSGLTAMPSSGAIYGSKVDTITDTGIRRDEYGDYCCAMGVWYGYCGDRFLIELENGTQFTTKICDSKGFADDGEGKYHNFGGDGKCIVEFIYADGYLPDCVAVSGNYGSYNWYGLNFDNIQSIKKINYGNPVRY